MNSIEKGKRIMELDEREQKLVEEELRVFVECDKFYEERSQRFGREFSGLSWKHWKSFYNHREDSDGLGRHGSGDWSDLTPSDRFDSVEKVRDAIADGRLHPHSKERPSGYGWVTHIEVCKFFGLPNPRKGQKAKRLKQLEEQVRKLKREILETAKEEEFQKHFSDKLLAEATANLIEAHFKTPATPKSLWDHIDQHEQ